MAGNYPEMEISEVERLYNDRRFGNEPVSVGNICWVKESDEEGIFEYPVRVIPDTQD